MSDEVKIAAPKVAASKVVTPKPAAEKAPSYWVTEGNIAHGADGLRRLGGEPIKIGGEEAAVLLKAKIITRERPEVEGDDE